MKKIFILTLLLFTAAAIFGIDKAAAQSMRLGIDGIEFTSVDEQKSPVAVGLPVRYSSSSFTLGRNISTTIPTFELGWNMLSPVDYDIYDGMNYGPFLDLNNWKSTQVTVNILNFSAFNRRRNFGISAAIGIRANNFRLDKSLTLADEGPMITPSTLGGDLQVKKSKFTVAALHIPVEISFGRWDKFSVSAGGFADIVMNSHTKIKYKGGSKDKEHNFPVNFIQAGATLRLSFHTISLYCNYTPTSIFKSGCGPRTQMWTIGIGI